MFKLQVLYVVRGEGFNGNDQQAIGLHRCVLLASALTIKIYKVVKKNMASFSCGSSNLHEICLTFGRSPHDGNQFCHSLLDFHIPWSHVLGCT
jgi:hypothetical protein